MPPVAPLPRLLSPPAALRDGKIRQGLRPLFPIRIKATGPQRRPRILPGGFLHNHAQKRLFRRHAACSAPPAGPQARKKPAATLFSAPAAGGKRCFSPAFFPAGADMALRRLQTTRRAALLPRRGGYGHPAAQAPTGGTLFPLKGRTCAKACCIQCMSLRKFLLSRTLRIQEEHVMPAQCTPVKQNLKKIRHPFLSLA